MLWCCVTMRCASWLFLVPLSLGCTHSVEPSPHPLDFQLQEGQRHVRNPDVTLRREYWVVVEESGKYFMFPRPDGADAIARECATSGPMASSFRDASLCAPASSKAQVDRVNSLSQSEAFSVSSFLHARLHFVVNEDGTTIAPYALLSDVVDICKSYSKDRLGKLENVCNRELAWQSGGARPAIAIAYTKDEAASLVSLLNDWYGVSVPK